MPDKNLTDTEIKKALECCTCNEYKCNICFLKGNGQCQLELEKSALDLINRLQEENERYKKYYFAHEYDKWEKEIKAEAYKECIEKAKSEIDRQLHSRSLEASGERFRIHKILDNLLKELVGE